MNRLLGIVLLFWLFSALAVAAPASKERVGANSGKAEIAWSDEESDPGEIGTKQVIGMVEKVHIEPGDFVLDARIDTGANTTSIGVKDLQIVNEDGQEWAIFTFNGANVRSKVVNFVRIKQHGAVSQRRVVIRVKITLGTVSQVVDATLTDRSNFSYKILIGVNFLRDHFIVDVSRKHVKALVPTP